MRLFTTKGIGWKGGTRTYSVRLADPIGDFLDAHVDPEAGLPDKSAVLQHAIGLWVVLTDAAEERSNGGRSA